MAWPTTSNPRTEFVTLRLTVDEASSLDALAASKGCSRSEAVRTAVMRVIAAEQKKARRTTSTTSTSTSSTGADAE